MSAVNIKKKVAILDDDHEFVEELAKLLKNENYEVLSETSLPFINLFEKNIPDIFLIDAWFNQQNHSLTFIKALKLNADFKNVPIVLMSSDESMGIEAKKMHIDAFVEKPINVVKLLTVLNKF